ncbi:HET-domain-containing protein [Staphylotrichum tortipilum]|uniref:HET-domain-containing protein n=1 Tax=Staphylotrichum tortipilum TaxID=2831512 RepID=A0AAN6RS07_9PEZI|nr:HET-domain-containing protein [Staphylotrichum longicolle]
MPPQQPPSKPSLLRRLLHLPPSTSKPRGPPPQPPLCPRCIAVLTSYFTPSPTASPRSFLAVHGAEAARNMFAARGCPVCILANAVADINSARYEYVSGTERRGTLRWTAEFEVFKPGMVQQPAGAAVSPPGQGDVVEAGYGPPPEMSQAEMHTLLYDLPGRSDDPACFALVRRWVGECAASHPNCGQRGEVVLPTRVLDLTPGAPGDGVVLVETGGAMRGRYVTLSHRWDAALGCKTTRGNLGDRRRGIELVGLPTTFREAVVVCCEVGVRYLWIDALCIVQDDSGDWDREAARMADVYSNSVFTISALDSDGSQGGLFRDRTPTDAESVTFPSPAPDHAGMMIGVRVAAPMFHKEMDASPLTPRGWVFQERVLSTATLHYGAKQMTWECRSMVATERSGRVHDFMEALTYEFGRTLWVARKDGWKTMAQWYDMLGYFTRKRFTVPTDRLPAAMGVAKMLEPLVWGQRENVFIAGLWSGALAKQLIWRYDSADAHRVLGPPTLDLIWVPPGWRPRQPSWSWISVDYPVSFWPMDAEMLDWHIKVLGWDRQRMADLTAYRDRPHEMELRLEGGLLRLPLAAETLGLQKPVYRVLNMRLGREMVEIELIIDPGCSIPVELFALRVSSYTGHGGVPGPRATWLLLLDRVRPGVNRFKRIGVASGSKDVVDKAFGWAITQVILV